jgi:triacylglycerol lipase
MLNRALSVAGRLCWGRIPTVLRKHGAEVYLSGQDAWGSLEHNALQLCERLCAVLAQSGATRVNIIAHSKGGLDARRMIAMLAEDWDFGEKGHSGSNARAGVHNAPLDFPVASLTTIATPHHGSASLERILRLPRPLRVSLLSPVGFAINRMSSFLGDVEPDFFTVCTQLTASSMQAFNAAYPRLQSVYSQQYGSYLHTCFDDLMSIGTYSFIKHFDGNNDGLVGLDSMRWDNFRGVLSTADGKGISHSGIVGASPKSRRDIEDFYVSLVAELKALGY